VADPSSAPSSPTQGDRNPAEPLRRWERIGALVVGLVSATVAGFALFLTSNQAGTAAFTIVAAAFLLIGVQGTALVRMSSGSGVVELERRQRVADAVNRAQELAKTEPEVARGIMEGLALVEPSVGPAAGAFQALSYEQAVRRALQRTRAGTAHISEAAQPADFRLEEPGGTVVVSVSYRRSQNLQINDLAPLVGSKDLEDAVGGLVVTNRPLTASVGEYVARASNHGLTIEVVTWNGVEDDPALSAALDRLVAAARARRVGGKIER
jgi:hypothetical protein